MTRFLLDTNILSDVIRNPRGRVAARIADVGEGAVHTNILVAAELRFGAAKKASERLIGQVERVLSVIDIMPFESPADAAYARIRVKLEASGALIGGNDMLIAAHAMATGCTVITDNQREFAKIDGLPVDNWLR